jgi:hypothetical protein
MDRKKDKVKKSKKRESSSSSSSTEDVENDTYKSDLIAFLHSQGKMGSSHTIDDIAPTKQEKVKVHPAHAPKKKTDIPLPQSSAHLPKKGLMSPDPPSTAR